MASSGPEKADCSQIISSTSPGGVPGDSGGSSTRPTLKITLLGSEWNSSAGGLSTFNRELAIHLSEHPQVDVTLLVPEGACKDEEKNEARRYGVNVVDAKFQAGFDPLYWLSCPPKDLHIDIVIGHGIKLGPQVQIIRNCVQFSTCKWVQVVHTAPEDLSKFKSYSDPTSKGEKKNQDEVDLCKRADLVMPVGPRLTESCSAHLRRWKEDKDIFSFTPGLFEREFGGLEQVANNNEDFKVLIVGRGDTEDFELKGLDIAAKAFADKRLKHKPYELTFVGAPDGKQEEVRERLLRCGIAKEQLTVRRFVQSRDRLKDLLCEADLAIMPSKSEGFGLVAVEALSAGLPILVGSRSGFAKALKGVVHGHSCVVHSDDPAKWAEAIEEVRDRHGMRLKEIQALKASYGEMYSWKKQCEALVERMWQIVPGNENWNISKSKASVEKHDAAGRTSEQQLHSVKERRRTLGTKKDESSPKKEPPEDLFRSSQVESTSDPGFVSTSLRLVITAQDLDVKQQEFIDGTLKSQIQAYTTYHDLSTPGSVGAFIEHITKAYNLAVQAVESGSLIVTVQCFTLEGLERLWNDYRSGCLNDIAERFLVTSELKRKLNLENFRLTITIEEENYLICKKTLMEKIESSIWSTVPNSVHRKTIDDIDDKGEMPKHMYEFGIRRKLKSPASTKMATGKAKSLDKMRMRELTEILEVLGLSDEGVENLSDATCRIRSALNAAEKMSNWSPGKAFSVLSEAKGEDVRRRCELIEFYTTAETILDKMHEHMITLLQKHIPNVKEDMKLHIKQLKEEEYYLLFAGETSSGKSSLINLILGEEILPYSHKCCTSTICELKFGDERRLVVHFKDKDHPETELPTEEIFLAQPTESFSYLDQIFPYVHVKNHSGNKGSIVKKIELFWPHSLLQTGLVIIDSPGVGESDEMDKMVVQYLPKAFAFVYVINSANAGGIQKDRLEKLLVMARDMSLGDPNQEREEGGLTSVIEEDPLSKCALFVCNKWEQVPQQEVQSVKDDTVKKLGKVWPGIDPESQITHMSTTRAVTAQNLGVITEEFSSVMDGIKSVILMSIEAKLELHWNWLHRFFTTIVIHAKVFLENASNTHDDINQKMEKVIHRLDVMKRGQKKVIQDLQTSFNEKVHAIFCQLLEYLRSEDGMARFTSWSEHEFPNQYISALTPEVEEKMDTLLSSRFQEVVKQWEEENHVFADARLSLVKKVKNCYDEAEFQRRNLLFDATDVHRGVSNFQKFRFSIPRRAYMKIRILTFGVIGLVAKSMDVTFITKLYEGSKIDFKDVISKASEQFLSSRREPRQIKKFVVDKLNDVKDCLGQIEVRLPELIEEDRELYSELYGQLLCNLEQETHFQEENKDRYRRIRDEGSQSRDQLALFGIKNVCTTKINHEELEWKEEKSSLLGSGSFSAVYQGTMRRCGEVATVALKVFNEALNADNASEIMQEMKMLRILKHPHIVQFYGIYLDTSSPMSTRVIFVMEKCKGNLRNHIFRELESTPGKSKKATTVKEFCHWVKQIIDGLVHIHELGVVHGDLKLENILLSEDNTVKIADVGLAKAETDITGTFKGTPVYMAPEVFHSQVYDSKADIYSLGLIMWEMWYGQRAFADAPGTTPQGLFDWVDKGNRPVHKQGCKTPPYFWERLMTQCWDGDPDKRPTAKKCQEWQFVTKSETRE